ncbi:MAG: aminoglycoside phosphotransferase family protein [Acidobacteria bacterium]|nr:aminoglycoside phosphotransferase family protein [Acidobacteriota bacterium]MBI3662677.1 aminoglycoside phosphotransferase family protein [Acidobacteriota bacterium]
MIPESIPTSSGVTSGERAALPDDPALPGSALLQQPAQLRDTLSRLLRSWMGTDAWLQSCTASLRRYVPGKRCIFELEVTIARERCVQAEGRRLVGKIFGLGEGAGLFRTLTELRRHGFATGSLLVPPPLAYDPDWQLLLLGWAEGELLRSKLLRRSCAEPQMQEAAAWLLKLHQCGMKDGRRYSFGQHMNALADQKYWMTRIWPDGERRLDELMCRIAERSRLLSGWTPGPTHRDFSPDHLMMNGNQLTALDFDEFCQYDPLFDVAHFIAHVRFLALTHFDSLTEFDRLAKSFVDAYRAGAKDFSDARLQLYLAIAYLKLAHIVAVVQHLPAWRQKVGTILHEAEQIV